MIEVGSVITVTGSKTIPRDFLGMFGVVTSQSYGDKWMVRFIETIDGIGGLSHTASEKDLVVIGKAFYSI